MTLNHDTRKMLNELSKQVFGSSSKWQKLVNEGVYEQYEREREVMVPRANGAVIKKVFTDKKFVAKRYTVEEILKFMTEALALRNGVVAQAPVALDSESIETATE